MTFCWSGIRSFPKLWKSKPCLGLDPGHFSPLFPSYCAIRNQQRWFSLKTGLPQNNKGLHLPITKARFPKARDRAEKKKVSSDSPHLFAAGAAKKRSWGSQVTNPDSKDQALPKKSSSTQLPTKPLNSEEWDRLKEDFEGKGNFEDWVSSQMSRCHSSIDVAKSLLAWVAAKNNGIISYNLLVNYLYLCVLHKQTSEVIDVYEIMKLRYKRLESSGYSLLIRGLIHSDRWREALLLLEDLKEVMIPTKKNYSDCIQGALLHHEVDMAWNLYQELLGHEIIPMMETLKAFFDFGKAIKDDHYSNKLLDILLYLRNNQLYPDESLVHSIRTWFESIPGKQWKGQFTTIQESGQCLGCGKTLESIHLSPEEYEFLKGKIMKDVIDGGDQYRKTTPQELKRFKEFVTSCPPFDIVIDGLNVGKSYSKVRDSRAHLTVSLAACGKQELIKQLGSEHVKAGVHFIERTLVPFGPLQLLHVVSQLAKQNLRLLVLGRKHMITHHSQWRKNEMQMIQQQARCFFADNISEDDPFLLYATLNSGNHCKFITNDLMRDHKACLSDAKTQLLFFKWQQGHQLAITNRFLGSKITFQRTLSYDTVVQTTGDSWHIPYDEDLVKRCSYEVPTKWLCLQQHT